MGVSQLFKSNSWAKHGASHLYPSIDRRVQGQSDRYGEFLSSQNHSNSNSNNNDSDDEDDSSNIILLLSQDLDGPLFLLSLLEPLTVT